MRVIFVYLFNIKIINLNFCKFIFFFFFCNHIKKYTLTDKVMKDSVFWQGWNLRLTTPPPPTYQFAYLRKNWKKN